MSSAKLWSSVSSTILVNKLIANFSLITRKHWKKHKYFRVVSKASTTVYQVNFTEIVSVIINKFRLNFRTQAIDRYHSETERVWSEISDMKNKCISRLCLRLSCSVSFIFFHVLYCGNLLNVWINRLDFWSQNQGLCVRCFPNCENCFSFIHYCCSFHQNQIECK